MARSRRPIPDRAVEAALQAASRQSGIPYQTLRSFAEVESGFKPDKVTGSMSGLFQLSPRQFRDAGGQGSIFDPHENARVAARLLSAHSQAFQNRYGRPPEPHELYMIHQQGWGGAQAHLDRPTRLAWESMASTAEGRRRDAAGPVYRDWGNPNGPRLLWSQAAIQRNLPTGVTDWRTATSGDFVGGWGQRLERAGIPRITDPQLTASATDPLYGSRQGYDLNPPGSRPGDRDLSALSAQELTRMAGPRTSPFEEVTGLTPNMNEIAGAIPAPVVEGAAPSAGVQIGNIFGQRDIPGAAGFGRALSVAGQTIANSGPRIPQFDDPARQMAALDAGAAWPTIPVRQRRPYPQTGSGRR